MRWWGAGGWSGIGGAAALVLMLGGCGGGGSGEIPEPGPIAQPRLTTAGGGERWNVLLLTLDTTRRDRMGCYGHAGGLTPHLDRLAERGILFEWMISPIPVTLPAHSTIMTGLNPNEHGVRNNGTFSLAPERVTLAEALAQRGYATGAVAGAVPVARVYGLDQGFAMYDDAFPPESSLRAWQSAERRADEVTRLSLAWLQAQSGPFFLWAHYFDPHAPYAAPDSFARAHPQAYDGEIAYMDAEIGRLLEGLAARGLDRTTWILCVGDHGEALGEHGEETHSMLLYRGTQEVPCLLVPPTDWRGLPESRSRGARVTAVAGLRDLAPTLLDALGIAPDALAASGSSLLPLVAGQWDGPRVAYMETLVPALEYGWSELRGVRTERWSYFRAPEAELYDLSRDPGERENLRLREPEVFARLASWCDRFTGGGDEAFAVAELDPQAIEQLRSLGYVAGALPGGESEESGKDPKALMHLLQEIDRARTLHAAQANLEARTVLEKVLEADDGNPAALRLLGNVLLYLGQGDDAAEIFTRLIERAPGDGEARLNRVRALLIADDLAAATAELALMAAEPGAGMEVSELYAQALARGGRLAEARRFLQALAQERAGEAGPLIALARIEWGEGRRQEARSLARQALDREGDLAGAHALLGEELWSQVGGEAAPEHYAAARAELERALALDPLQPMAAFRLAWIERRAGNLTRASELYERVVSAQPDMAEAHINLGNLLLEARRLPEAMRHYQVARQLGNRSTDFLTNYGVALAMSGQNSLALEVWEQALATNPDERTAAGLRANIARLRGAAR